MERQLTVNQVYKLTELRSFNQELENKEAHTGDDQDHKTQSKRKRKITPQQHQPITKNKKFE